MRGFGGRTPELWRDKELGGDSMETLLDGGPGPCPCQSEAD